MILAKRVKKAFVRDAQGKLAPVGENLFQFARSKNRRGRREGESLKASLEKVVNDQANLGKGNKTHENRDLGSLGQA